MLKTEKQTLKNKLYLEKYENMSIFMKKYKNHHNL